MMDISIHALLAESDGHIGVRFFQQSPFLSTLSLRRATLKDVGHHCIDAVDFYPRSPCGERLDDDLLTAIATLFLSTLSLRRATMSAPWSDRCHPDFYPRSPCGERHASTPVRHSVTYFYPRSPCGERRISMVMEPITHRFLSTLSLRRATGRP